MAAVSHHADALQSLGPKPTERTSEALRLIVADDDAPSRELVRYLLAGQGFDIHVAQSGLEAYDVLRSADVPTIAILDWMMPGMSGVDICKAIRKQSIQHYTYVILLTFKTERTDLIEALLSGADDYLKKPVDVGELLARLNVATRILGYLRDLRSAEGLIEAGRVQAVASARLSALGMMAGTVAHEINNPLAIIHGLSSNLMEAAERGEGSRQTVLREASRIRQTAARISKIVKSLRVISRDGSADPYEDVTVRRVVDEALELCQERFKANSVRLTVAPIDDGLSVFCREVQIAQVLINLLQNAFDAVITQDKNRWVEIRIAVLSERVIMSVVDSGPGIAQEVKPRMMDPFFTTKPVGKGTGLGLSLSKVIAEQHGGDLEVTEAAGHTCVSLIIPQKRRY